MTIFVNLCGKSLENRDFGPYFTNRQVYVLNRSQLTKMSPPCQAIEWKTKLHRS